MPRVVNLALAAVLLLFLVPVLAHLGDVPVAARVVLVLVALAFAPLLVLALMAAVRPGSVGRLGRRLRRTR